MLLVVDILASFAAVRWRMTGHDIPDVVRGCRAHRVAPRPDSLETGRTAQRLARAVRRSLSALPCDATCLHQSLVLCSLLSARGISNTIVIGAHVRGEEFAAHAWVEHQGRPLLAAQEFQESRLLEL